jgi:hypothetical protein
LVNQLKFGGEIPAKGNKIVLHVQNVKNLGRDFIKVRNYPFAVLFFVACSHAEF